MIDTVILDIGNVMVSFDWRAYLDRFEFGPEKKAAIAKATFQSPYWQEVDRGLMAKEMLRRRFAFAAPEYEQEISYVFENYPTLLKEYPYAIPWVKDLKARGYKVYYLSNYGKWPYEQSKSQLGFMDYTDGGLLSYEVHMVKPERAFYLELLDRYDIIPDHAVFLDDSQVNIDVARSLGLHGILFTGYEDAVEELDLLGV